MGTGIQVGRYLTTQLKLEIGLRGPVQYFFYETDRVPAPALTGGFATESIDRHVRVFSFAPAITWQFFENSFAHPYLSAGVAMDVSDIHRFRQAGTGSIVQSRTTVRYDVPGVDTRETLVEARPFLAVGSKSVLQQRPVVRASRDPGGHYEVAHRPGVAALRRRCGLLAANHQERIMTTRIVVCVTLMALLATPLRAQDRAAEATAWQSLAATLQPGTLIEIRMKDGTHFKGTFVQRLGERVVVKPRTRVAVPAREIAIAEVESIATAKHGMSPAKRVLIGLGVGIGTMALIGAVLVANAY